MFLRFEILSRRGEGPTGRHTIMDKYNYIIEESGISEIR